MYLTLTFVIVLNTQAPEPTPLIDGDRHHIDYDYNDYDLYNYENILAEIEEQELELKEEQAMKKAKNETVMIPQAVSNTLFMHN